MQGYPNLTLITKNLNQINSKQIQYLTPTKLVNYIEKHKLINYFYSICF
nr:MAG TPA: hypothetical protein [Caudoviricetes sp.]